MLSVVVLAIKSSIGVLSPANCRYTSKRMSKRRLPIRLLTAVPICDGHDSAINTINLELIRHGVEVIYLGYHRSAQDIVRAAIQEDASAIGISSYNGGHVEFFIEVLNLLKRNRARNIHVFGGGGGTITPQDAARMKTRGVDRIFPPGTSLDQIVEFVTTNYGSAPARRRDGTSDARLARLLTDIERGSKVAKPEHRSGYVVGVTGPGGAGKTTLIDELVLRFLAARPKARIAILSHDPSIVGKGALLGDRATMIYSQDDRVFMRSFATRGQSGGLAIATEHCVRAIQSMGFDVVFIETVGIGQEAIPFHKARGGLADTTILVMSPDYGARLQLQKIAMLDAADIVVVNKSDMPGAATASAEIEQRIATNQRSQKIVATTAKRHRDAGVDELFQLLNTPT